MIKRNKALSIVMAICLCMALLAPVFVSPPTAEAANSTYSVLRPENVSATGGYINRVVIQLDVTNVRALSDGDLVTLHLPTGLEFDNVPGTAGNEWDNPKVAFSYETLGADACICMDSSIPYVDDGDGKLGLGDSGYRAPGAANYVAPVTGPNLRVFAPKDIDANNKNAFDALGSFVAYAVGINTVDIVVKDAAAAQANGKIGQLLIEFTNVKVTDSFDGDIAVNFLAPDNGGFDTKYGVVIGKYISSGTGTTTMAKSITTMSTGTKKMDVIMIEESVTGALKTGEKITLDLPAGFAWDIAGAAVKGAWGYSSLASFGTGLSNQGNGTLPTANGQFGTNGTDKLVIQMPNVAGATSQGRLYIDGAKITVEDDNVAKKGEVAFNVSSNLGNVTDQDVVIANYVDYGVTVEEVKVAEVVAGWNDTELGDFRIKEGIAGSIVPNRVISLTVPAGVKWHTAGTTWPQLAGVNPFTFEAEKGSINSTDLGGTPATTSNNGRTIKLNVGPGPFNQTSSFLLKKLKVTIAPDFSGDLNIEVGGTAGVSGTVKVATVKPSVELTNDGSAKIIIGSQNQEAGDIVITENKKEAIKAEAGKDTLLLNLPDGAEWAVLPKVEVTEGDAVIDKATKNGQSLSVKMKSSSTKPSTIKISGIKVTTDRNIPEGDFKVKLTSGSNALTDNAGGTQFDVAAIQSVVIGQCVTPAPVDGTPGAAAGQFKIDSNIYQLNGVAKVMDVAPYIKSGRTYVPVRYLAYVLGVAEADVVWDEGSQKVTLTRGDNVVELTIGSTTITVNGEAQTMDVAPEITNGRTMLPARYVAEGLGYAVGWDPGSRTVLISK